MIDSDNLSFVLLRAFLIHIKTQSHSYLRCHSFISRLKEFLYYFLLVRIHFISLNISLGHDLIKRIIIISPTQKEDIFVIVKNSPSV